MRALVSMLLAVSLIVLPLHTGFARQCCRADRPAPVAQASVADTCCCSEAEVGDMSDASGQSSNTPGNSECPPGKCNCPSLCCSSTPVYIGVLGLARVTVRELPEVTHLRAPRTVRGEAHLLRLKRPPRVSASA